VKILRYDPTIITIDQSTLTATTPYSAPWSPVLLQAKDTTGKHYFEVQQLSDFHMKTGLCNLSVGDYWYLDDDRGGSASSPACTKASIPGYALLARIMVAYDLDSGKVWFGVNGTWFASGNPANNLNPSMSGITVFGAINPVFPYIEVTGSNVSARFYPEASGWLYPAPAGFLEPTALVVTPKMMTTTLRRDMVYGGGHQIIGTAQRLGANTRKRIRLHDRRTGLLIRETWSGTDGSFAFLYLKNAPESYIVMELDDETNDPWLDPACADRVSPEMMP